MPTASQKRPFDDVPGRRAASYDRDRMEPVGSSTPPQRRRPTINHVAVAIAIFTAVVAFITLLVTISYDHHTSWVRPRAPAVIESEAQLSDYVRSQPYWLAEPTVYPSAVKLAYEQQTAHRGAWRAQVGHRALAAYTPGTLAAEGSLFAGRVIYLVGRLSFRSTSEKRRPQWTGHPLTDIELTAPYSHRPVTGLLVEPVVGHTQEVVVVRAVVVAVGPTSIPRSTAYVVGLEGLTPARDAGSNPSLQALIKEYRRAESLRQTQRATPVS